MSDYRVKLEVYDGPLDLLLYLIRRDEIDIYNLPVAKITEQYLAYINLMEELDVDLAGEFLVMAATLIELKSLMVIPREQSLEDIDGEGATDPSDPRLELIHQLLEYKRFKDAAGLLDKCAEERSNKFHRPLADLQRLRQELKSEQELDMESVQIWDLMDAFARLMTATMATRASHNVVEDETPIDVYEVRILTMAQRANPLIFEAIFKEATSREEFIGLFLAILELMRHRLIRIEQEKAFGTIYVFPLVETDPQQAVLNTISGAAIQSEEEELLKEVGMEKAEPERLFSDGISITEDLAGFSETVEEAVSEMLYESDEVFSDEPGEDEDHWDELEEIERKLRESTGEQG